jgi:single-strand DNA-binding protein
VGRLKQDRWEDAEGKTRSKVHIVAEHVEFKPKFKNDSAENQENSSDNNESEEDVDFPEGVMEAAS